MLEKSVFQDSKTSAFYLAPGQAGQILWYVYYRATRSFSAYRNARSRITRAPTDDG